MLVGLCHVAKVCFRCLRAVAGSQVGCETRPCGVSTVVYAGKPCGFDWVTCMA